MRSSLLMASMTILMTITFSNFCSISASGQYLKTVYGRGTGSMAQDLAPALALARGVFDMLMALASAVMQIKSFGISVVNVLINLVRAAMQAQQMQKMQEMIEWQKMAVEQMAQAPAPVKYYMIETGPEQEQRHPEHLDFYTHSDPEHAEHPATHYTHMDPEHPATYYTYMSPEHAEHTATHYADMDPEHPATYYTYMSPEHAEHPATYYADTHPGHTDHPASYTHSLDRASNLRR